MRNVVELVKDYAVVECRHKGSVVKCKVSTCDLEMLELLGNDISIIYNSQQGRKYARMRINGKPMLLHRFLMSAEINEIVSFVDGDSLNCCRDNLYIGTSSEINRANIVRANRMLKDGNIGVSETWKHNGRYMARIVGDNGRKYLGSYDTKEGAIKARRQAEINNWGM